ncbi:hypothetical protein KST23_02865 [Fusobacterium nucleatum]|uniref:hypothetical protein n=1 Tax=Fusobacterium nucleatum TaxID=851 RepID=UPI003D047EED
MNKNKIILFFISLFILTACSSIDEYLPDFLTESSVPVTIREAVASRVNPEKEIYVLASSQLSKSGPIIAQSRANKQASETLRKEIKKEIEALYRGNLDEMDAFSKSVVSPVVSDLVTYSTDLSMKKVTQKGAWEDSEKIYTLLTVNRNEVITTADKVFKKFIEDASKNLGKAAK